MCLCMDMRIHVCLCMDMRIHVCQSQSRVCVWLFAYVYVSGYEYTCIMVETLDAVGLQSVLKRDVRVCMDMRIHVCCLVPVHTSNMVEGHKFEMEI